MRMRDGLVDLRDDTSRPLAEEVTVSEGEGSRNHPSYKYEDKYRSKPRIIGNVQLVPPGTP